MSARNQAIATLMRFGWTPPPKSEEWGLRLLEDMTTVDRHGATLDLSRRQLEILCLVAEGFTKQEMADRLGVSAETVKDQTKRLYDKLGAKNGPNAVAIAYQDGILTPEPLEAS